MSRYAVCDNCGHRDDCSFGNGPILQGGLVLNFRDKDNGFEKELELCVSCRDQLLALWPKLKEAMNNP